MKPFITVVVCTRDRAENLRRLLESLTRLQVPPALRWDVLIIDNGGTDHTAEVIGSFAGRLALRRAVEPEPGIAAARNRGAALANGDYILWTDDDCEADPQWLAAYAAAIARYPRAALFAGRIAPVLEEPVTPWFRDHLPLLAWVVAERDFGAADLPLSAPEDRLPFCANAAVRAAEQKRFAFDTALGLKPGSRMVGEEITCFRAMLAAGAEGYWVPAAKILHHIPTARQSTGYIAAYFNGHGAFDAHRSIAGGAQPRLRVLRHYLPRLVFNFLAFRLGRMVLPPHLWLRRLMNFATAAGAIAYAWHPANARLAPEREV